MTFAPTFLKQFRQIIWVPLILVFVQSPLLSNAVFADDNVTNTPELIKNQDMVKEVAKDLRCPTCTGISVLESDAPFSNQIKNEVAAQLSQGKSKDEILSFFVNRYGPWILRAPPMEGVSSLAWIIPILFLLSVPIIAWLFFRKKKIYQEGAILHRNQEDIVLEMHDRLSKLRQRSLQDGESPC